MNLHLASRSVLESCSTLLALLLLFGCSDDGNPQASADESGTADSSSTAAADSTSGGLDVEALYGCVDPGFTEARPLVGAGYDPEGGLVDPQGSYVVSSTQVLVHPDKQNDFQALVGQVMADLDSRDGVVAYALAIEPTCGFARTLAVFRSEDVMIGFVTSDAHANAMAQTPEIAITGKVTHWTVAADAFPPTWDSAREQLAAVDPFVY